MAEAAGTDAIWKDPIVEEVREARRALMAAAGDDLHSLCEMLRERQARFGHEVVRRAPRMTSSGGSGEAA